MRDWRGYVRERLESLRLAPEEIDEVADELAGHLEERYEALRAQGVPEDEAFARSCAEAGNWAELRQGVVLAKQEGRMSDRVKQIWLPSLITLFVGWAVLTLMMWKGLEPIIWRPGNSPIYMVFYWPWLLLLPVVGAGGAYLSRRARACGWRVYVAGTFPALAIACVFLLILPWSLVIDAHVAHDFALGLAAMMTSWVILPGIALGIGVAAEGVRHSRTIVNS
ncbi:MAG: permease prefix domain 1-containing protein [Candidatus Acidiferrum sp.]